MGFFKDKGKEIFSGTVELSEVPDAKIFHIPSKLDLKMGDVELKAENIDQRILLEIVGMLTGAECKRPSIDITKLEGDKSPKVAPADRQAKIDKISKIQHGDDIEVFDLAKLAKETKLPHISHKFRCPDCEQSILLGSKEMVIVRDLVYGTNKLYSIPVDGRSFPEVRDSEGNIDFDKAIAIYNDCITLVKENKGEAVQFVSDSEDEAYCPICNSHHQIREFVNKYENDINDNKCDVCGGTKETTISNNGETLECSSNDCYSKLIKKNG